MVGHLGRGDLAHALHLDEPARSRSTFERPQLSDRFFDRHQSFTRERFTGVLKLAGFTTRTSQST